MRRVAAPGKLVIAGEYAVLRGAPALVTAVRREVVLWVGDVDAPVPPPPEVRETLRLGGAGALVARVSVDAGALRHGEHKLGLGSSAAAAAAAAKLALGDDASADAVFALALAGHRAVAPEGSGIDVAASSHGGTLVFTRGAAADAAPTLRRATWPRGLSLSVVFTGTSARTSDLVARVNALEAAEPSRHARLLGALGDAAAQAIAACDADDAATFVRAIDAHHDAMAALGHAAGAPIVEARLAALARAARAAGGAAKPSGAGGGDVAIAAFVDEGARRAFESAVRTMPDAVVLDDCL